VGALVATLLLASTGCGGAQERKASYLEKGQKYFDARNYEKASVEFRNALQIDPNDPNARYHVGQVNERLGNPRDAAGQYQAAIDQDAKFLPARAALARLYLLSGLPDRAMELVEPGLTQDPKNAPLLTVRGAAKSQLGNVPGAFEDAEAAVKLAPDDEYAIALLASLYRSNARSDKAIEVVRAGLEKLPASIDLHVVLADLEMGQQHLPEAEAQLKKVIELQPKELTHRYRLARFYLLTKNVAAAEKTMRENIAVAPENNEAKVALAELIASQRGVEKGEAELKAFVAKEKDSSALRLALARFYESHKKPEQAQAVYREVIEAAGVKPDGLTARNKLAALLIQNNQQDAAKQLVEEVLKENARDNDALILRGNLLLAKGDAPGAIADLRAVLRDQPNAIPVMRALARAHLQNDELAIAEETLRSASQASPGDRAVRLELAQLLAQSGRPEQAKPMLEQLATETPDDLPTQESLFRTLATLKDMAGARTTAEHIRQMRPDLPIGPYLVGTVDESEQKLDAAATEYESALKAQPDAGEPLAAVVRVDLARKQPAHAVARLDEVIQLNPKNAIARNLKGEVLTSQKQFDPALASFNEAIALAPKWWIPYRGAALAQLASQQPKSVDAAIEVLERGVKATNASNLTTDLAALYERQGKSDNAIGVYEAWVQREPHSTVAANNLAMLLVTYRTDPASLEKAQQLTEKFSSSSEPSLLNTRGWVKFKRGDYQGALGLLAQAVDKSPDSPVMRYHLGMAQLKNGDAGAARENLEAAVKSGRAFMGSKEAQAALDQIKQSG
jgi:tetratricopeptide (TPR) repeat protein